MKVNDKIRIGNLEGKTSKTGLKQNKIYTIIGISNVKGFYTAIDSKGREWVIWLLHESETLNQQTPRVGIYRNNGRTSYTNDFEII